MLDTAEELYKTRANEIRKKINGFEKIGIISIELNNYNNFKDILSLEDFKSARRIINRKKWRRKNCYKKLEPIINLYEELYYEKGIYCNIVFGTCTFDNNAIEWKEETRTKKVNKWIKEHFQIALANIDYGLKNEREHHHFIGLTFEELEDIGKKGKKGFKIYNIKNNKNYDIGFEPDLEIVDLDKIINDRKLSNYLVKLNFHSNKKSTRNRRIRVLKNN